MTQVLPILLIIIGGFLLKLPFLCAPIAGNFGSYQALNAMMAYTMQQGSGINAWIDPKLFNLVGGEPALHLIYYPFGSFFSAVLNNFLNGSLDFSGRLQAALFSAGSSWLFYLAIRKLFDQTRALLATGIFTFAPFSLIYGMSLMNESACLFFLVASFWLVVQRRFFLGGFFFSLALTGRLHFMFVGPALIYLCFIYRKRISDVLMFLLAASIPVFAWFAYTYYLQQQYPESVITSLFFQLGEGRIATKSIFLEKDFLKSLCDTLSSKLLTPLLFPFALIGFLRRDKPLYPFALWAGGMLFVIFLLPDKVLDHPFYLIFALPALSLLAASSLVLMPLSVLSRALFLGVCLLFSLSLFLPPALSGWKEGSRLISISTEAQKMIPRDALVIAQYGSSPELLYHLRRKGWDFDLLMRDHPLEDQPRHQKQFAEGYGDPIKWLENLRGKGAQYLLISQPELIKQTPLFEEYMNSHYKLLATPSQRSFLIYDLEFCKFHKALSKC